MKLLKLTQKVAVAELSQPGSKVCVPSSAHLGFAGQVELGRPRGANRLLSTEKYRRHEGKNKHLQNTIRWSCPSESRISFGQKRS